MNTYAIRRRRAWGSPEEAQRTAARSKETIDDEFTDELRWIRSYVIEEEDGTLGSLCIDQATDADAIRAHAKRARIPADEVWSTGGLVVNRLDPPDELAAP
jgi:hypothetical protein